MQTRDVVIVGLVALFGLFFFLAFMSGGMMGPGMMGGSGWGDQGMGAWWGTGMMLFWLVPIAGVVGLLVWLFRGGTPAAAGPTGSGMRAEEILKERYARGEITREEYDQMRRDLRDG